MNRTISIIVETKGRSCDGCTKCCEGWLTANIYGFEMNPTNGACRFLAKSGCGIYAVREPLCKNFQCDWKENTAIPEYLKPDKCNAIIMTKRLENYRYYRIITAGIVKKYVYEWAEEQTKMGKHVVVYGIDGELIIYSNDQQFKSLARAQYEKQY